MDSVQELKPIKISRRDVLFSISVLIMVVWFGNFFEFSQFTLYSDDQVFLANVFRSPYTIVGWFNTIIPYSDGRPLQFGLIAVEGALITVTRTLASAYFFMFLGTAISVMATWWALTYRFSNEVALAAASVFALSPLVSIRP